MWAALGLVVVCGVVKVSGDFAVARAPEIAAVVVPPVQTVQPLQPAAKKVKKAAVGQRRGKVARAPAAVLVPVPVPVSVPAVEAPLIVAEEAFSAPPLLSPEPEPEPAPAPEPEAPLDFDGNGEQIAQAIANAKRGAVQTCFERELKQNPALRGNVLIELELAPPQQVHAVRVSDDLERPAFTKCVSAALQRLSFTGLDEDVSIQIPYALSPRGK